MSAQLLHWLNQATWIIGYASVVLLAALPFSLSPSRLGAIMGGFGGGLLMFGYLASYMKLDQPANAVLGAVASLILLLTLAPDKWDWLNALIILASGIWWLRKNFWFRYAITTFAVTITFGAVTSNLFPTADDGPGYYLRGLVVIMGLGLTVGALINASGYKPPKQPYSAHFASLNERGPLVLPKTSKLANHAILLANDPQVREEGSWKLQPTAIQSIAAFASKYRYLLNRDRHKRYPEPPPFRSRPQRYPYTHYLALRPGTNGGRRELGHVLVVGPSRSGKSLMLTENLLHWSGSAVVMDIKGELYRHTAAYRQQHKGQVLVLDPTGYGNRYDPFKELSYSSEALRSAALLILQPNQDKDPVFAQRATSGMYAALRAAHLEQQPTLPYLRALTGQGPLHFITYLSQIKDPELQYALTDFLGKTPKQFEPSELQTNRFFDSAWVQITTRSQPLFTEGILKMTSGSDFQAKDLQSKPSTLYLIFRESEQESTTTALQLVQLALVQGMIRNSDLLDEEVAARGEVEGRGKEVEGRKSKVEGQKIAGGQGSRGAEEKGQGQEPVPVLLGFDEAGRVPIPRLPNLVSTVAGRGMTAMILVQDLSQLEGAYGKPGASTIRNNCHTKVFYRPEDLTTAQYISQQLGKTSIQQVSVSRGESFGFSDFTFSESESYTESTSYKDRELQTVDELRMQSPEQVIIFASELPPALGHRLKYFEAPVLASLTQWHSPPIKALPEVQLPAHLLPKEEPKPKRVRKAKPEPKAEEKKKDDGDSDYFDIG